MGRVIDAPVVEKGRRALPVGLSSPHRPAQEALVEEGGSVNESKPQVQNNSTEQGLDKIYVERLTADRDAALERVKELEEQLLAVNKQLADDRENAKELGYQEGFKQASAQALAEQEQELDAIKALLLSMAAEKVQLIKQAEDAAVDIGFAAAVKIMGQASVDRTLVIAMIKRSMGQIAKREGLLIRLSPADYRRLDQYRMQQKKGDEWITEVEFKSDEHVGLGGCIIESGAGSLDARLELQVDELKKLLLDARSSSR